MRTRRQHSSSDSAPQGAVHIPVLLQETIRSLAIRENDVVVDATLGGAGHAKEVLARLGTHGMLIGIDADGGALQRARETLKDHTRGKTAHFVKGNFRNLASILDSLGVKSIDKALFDLGWSGMQLAAGRGFSFQTDDPLLMTYDDVPPPNATVAAHAVNEWSEENLRTILEGFGEEHFAARIARAIVARRTLKPFTTARELGEAVRSAMPVRYRYGKTHPATKTFQALRIAINDELGAIREGYRAAWSALAVGGRIALITFHSVEDRLVKTLMRADARSGRGRLVEKRPIVPAREEVLQNPRARSAKLRVIEKNPGISNV